MNAHELQSGRMSAMFLGTLAIMFGIADADVITVDDDDPAADFPTIQEPPVLLHHSTSNLHSIRRH